MMVLGVVTPGYNWPARYAGELSLGTLGWIMIADSVAPAGWNSPWLLRLPGQPHRLVAVFGDARGHTEERQAIASRPGLPPPRASASEQQPGPGTAPGRRWRQGPV